MLAPKSPDPLTILHSVTVTEDSASEDPRVVLRAAFLKEWGLPYLHRAASESWHRFLILLPAEWIWVLGKPKSTKTGCYWEYNQDGIYSNGGAREGGTTRF